MLSVSAALTLSALFVPLSCGGEPIQIGTGGAGGSEGGAGGSGGAGASGGSGGSAASGGSGGAGGAGGAGASGGTGGTGGAGASGGSGGSGGGPAAVDPTQPGPYTFAALDDTVAAPSGGMVAVHAVYPTAGPSQGPYPVVVVGHGFQLPPTQYYKYLESLAGYGYVALTVDFQAGFFGVNNVNNAKDLLAGLDWAAAEPALAGKADTNNAGATGHSLGGKLSLLAATLDPRIKASITLDPVDGAMGCNPTDCPDVSNLLPMLSIPTGFLGETLDASGGFMPCAPAANNFLTFYQSANSPSFAVTVSGANHMSFLDDVAGCGFSCSLCQMATADNATVNALSRAYVVAFYERHLRGIEAYDAWLTGAAATAKWGNLVSIQSK